MDAGCVGGVEAERKDRPGDSEKLFRAGVEELALFAGAGVADCRPPRRPPAPKMLSRPPRHGVPGAAEPARLNEASSRFSLKKEELKRPTGEACPFDGVSSLPDLEDGVPKAALVSASCAASGETGSTCRAGSLYGCVTKGVSSCARMCRRTKKSYLHNLGSAQIPGQVGHVLTLLLKILALLVHSLLLQVALLALPLLRRLIAVLWLLVLRRLGPRRLRGAKRLLLWLVVAVVGLSAKGRVHIGARLLLLLSECVSGKGTRGLLAITRTLAKETAGLRRALLLWLRISECKSTWRRLLVVRVIAKWRSRRILLLLV